MIVNSLERPMASIRFVGARIGAGGLISLQRPVFANFHWTVNLVYYKIVTVFGSEAKLSAKRVPFFATSQKGSMGATHTRHCHWRLLSSHVRALCESLVSDCAGRVHGAQRFVFVNNSENKRVLSLDSNVLPVPSPNNF